MPERMQLRNVPISPVEEGSTELDMEADWIYKHAFSKASISNQVLLHLSCTVEPNFQFIYLPGRKYRWPWKGYKRAPDSWKDP